MPLSYIASHYPDVHVNAKAELVTLAPGSERRFAPLARGIEYRILVGKLMTFDITYRVIRWIFQTQ